MIPSFDIAKLPWIEKHPRDIKAIILGQDPYPYRDRKSGKLQAIGHAFAVEPDVAIPYSLEVLNLSLNEIGITPDPELKCLRDKDIILANILWTTEYAQIGAHITMPVEWEEGIYTYPKLTAKLVAEIARANPFRRLKVLTLGKMAEGVKRFLRKDTIELIDWYHTSHPAAVKHGVPFDTAVLKKFLNGFY